MLATQIQNEITAMKQWCMDNYDQGADTMVECWGTEDYAELFAYPDGTPRTAKQAWQSLKDIVAVYKDRQADARNSVF
jgi:hypothetical protein